jgi:hypothetical protein
VEAGFPLIPEIAFKPPSASMAEVPIITCNKQNCIDLKNLNAVGIILMISFVD